MIGFTVDSETGKNLPAWARIGFYDQESAEFFMPLQMTGNEEDVYKQMLEEPGLLMIVKFAGHHYGPLSWLIQKYPEHTEQLERIQRTLIAQMRTN